ncbi:MAG: TIGR03905 family protein, partial [Desulfobacca sp.]|nr:TIGR03905 family protein [Desulfobacca sp.]
MTKAEPHRYIYRTQGVCPPEIHFQIEGDLLKEVRFVGGGCPGNAQLVSRLLKDRPWETLFELLNGCPCKNKTSCPDQLALALQKVQQKELLPARSFQIVTDGQTRRRLALV